MILMDNFMKVSIKKLINALKTDKNYYNLWESFMSQHFLDEYFNYKENNNKEILSKEDIYFISRKASKNFLNMLINLKK